MQWVSFDNGTTIGQTGSESGVIVQDSEHPLGAKITLESASRIAPYAITCGIYGSMVHTCFFATEQEASQQFLLMASSLDAILQTTESDDDLIGSISNFVEQFP